MLLKPRFYLNKKFLLLLDYELKTFKYKGQKDRLY
jgi:hypothetical protein